MRPLTPTEALVLRALREKPEGCLPDITARVWGPALAPRVRRAIDTLSRRGLVTRSGRAWKATD